ncbi:MAG: glycosyltransferase family 4 protein [Patescibacteria group bacterium]
MNILVFSWRDPKHPLAGGAEQSVHEHMKGWVKKGHNVTLFSSRVIGLKSEELIDGVKIIRRSFQYIGVQIVGFFYYLKNKNNIDFVVDQFHGIPFFTPLYVTKPKLAVLQEVAKEVWFKNPLKFPLNLIIGFIGFITEPIIFLFYRKTHFMVGSASAKLDLLKWGIKNKNIMIVNHGIIFPRVLPKHDYKSKMITFFGRITPDKGAMDAIKTFSILNTDGNFKFCMTGRIETDEYYQKILSESKRLGLGKSISFLINPTDEEKFKILSKTMILINPSAREGWCIINIEANAVGTSVVAYPSPGLIDSVNNGVSGILTKDSTPEDLAREVILLVNDKKKYQKLSEGAINWSSKFSYSEASKLSEKLIRNLSHI